MQREEGQSAPQPASKSFLTLGLTGSNPEARLSFISRPRLLQLPANSASSLCFEKWCHILQSFSLF